MSMLGRRMRNLVLRLGGVKRRRRVGRRRNVGGRKKRNVSERRSSVGRQKKSANEQRSNRLGSDRRNGRVGGQRSRNAERKNERVGGRRNGPVDEKCKRGDKPYVGLARSRSRRARKKITFAGRCDTLEFDTSVGIGGQAWSNEDEGDWEDLWDAMAR